MFAPYASWFRWWYNFAIFLTSSTFRAAALIMFCWFLLLNVFRFIQPCYMIHLISLCIPNVAALIWCQSLIRGNTVFLHVPLISLLNNFSLFNNVIWFICQCKGMNMHVSLNRKISLRKNLLTTAMATTICANFMQ